MKPAIDIPHERIAEFCRRWEIREFALFGSVVSPDFRAESDVDVMVAFAPAARRTLFDLGEMQQELSELFGRHVDLVTRSAIESSRNPYRRNSILRSVEVVHAA